MNEGFPRPESPLVQQSSNGGGPSVGKLLVSLWLIFHLGGIAMAPATVPPSPPLFRQLYPLFGGYLEFLNLNQGNHFFAPDPGPSTLISYIVETEDGRTIRGRIPDRRMGPRLFYHRHFMLTESLGNADFASPRVQELTRRAFARHLLKSNQGRSVVLSRLTHELPTMEQYRSLPDLEAPESYLEEPQGRFSWTDFSP